MQHPIAIEAVTKARREQWDNDRCAEMVARAPDLIDPDTAPPREWSDASASRLLSLAAAPTFAFMAWLTGIHGGSMPDMLCSPAGNGLRLSGMSLMYWLMSAFHLGPWLKLISPRRSGAPSSA
jgi:hypothetical protein